MFEPDWGLIRVTSRQAMRNSSMWDKADQFGRQAQDCRMRAAGARDPIDEDAWLKLAEEGMAFANEAAAKPRIPLLASGHPASE